MALNLLSLSPPKEIPKTAPLQRNSVEISISYMQEINLDQWGVTAETAGKKGAVPDLCVVVENIYRIGTKKAGSHLVKAF